MEKILNDFAIFILSHGRADKIYTLQSLKKAGYSGRLFIICDDEDDTIDEYKKRFGDKVIVFNKQAVVDSTDTMDTLNEHRAILYARREAFNIAKKLGIKYFLQLDDDIQSFSFRVVSQTSLRSLKMSGFDTVCASMIEFLQKSNAITVAFCQAGDFIGGINNNYKSGLVRKAMNSFFCDTEKFIDFRGTMNEDVTTYVTLGSRGVLFLSFVKYCLHPKESQVSAGGMSEVYLSTGTYIKAFYSVMAAPSCVKISYIKDKHARLHHNVNWGYAVPKIISERYKKHE